MGTFLSMSGIVGAKKAEVIDAIQTYAAAKNAMFVVENLTSDDDGCLVISESARGVVVLYPDDFFEWDDASQFISSHVKKPVFSLHIHDGDLWMYLLFENGEEIDRFNPVPDYWEELPEDERRSWQGSAVTVARCVPGREPGQVTNYLVRWGDEVIESGERMKAYPDDQFCFGDDWQVSDFMNKLGLDFPIDDQGEPKGTTFRFRIRPGNPK